MGRAARRKFILAMGAFLLAGLVSAPVAAEDRQKDHDRARLAVKSGKILPLNEVLKSVEKKYPGKVVDADVREVAIEKTKRRQWRYFLKILDSEGRVTDLVVEAKSAKVLEAKRGGKPPKT